MNKIDDINASLKSTALKIRDIARTAELAERELDSDERKSVTGLLNDMEKLEIAKVSAQADTEEAKSNAAFASSVKSAVSMAEAKEINADALKSSSVGGLEVAKPGSIGEMFLAGRFRQDRSGHGRWLQGPRH